MSVGKDGAREENALREAICAFGRSLFERGLTPGSSGNLSARLSDGGWLATPTNASLGFLDPARLSKLDAQGRLVSGDPPTKEIPLHAAMYEARAGARAVAHLHCAHCVALSMTRGIDPDCALPAMTPYQLMKCGATALIPYHRPGDPNVADAIRRRAGAHASMILANHGPVVAGDSLEAAVYAIEELEETARLFLMTRRDDPKLMTRAQVDEVNAAFKLGLETSRFRCEGEPGGK